MPARRWMVAVVGSLALFGVHAAHSASNLQTLHESSGAYVLQYPTTLKVNVPKGEGCSNGTCREIERVDLAAPDGSMTLVIQRDINPKGLAIRTWYESLIKRPLNPATESLVAIGGRDAVRRTGLVPAESVHMVNGKEVSRGSTLRDDDSIFVPLAPTDVLTIVVHAKSQSARATFNRVIETLRFR